MNGSDVGKQKGCIYHIDYVRNFRMIYDSFNIYTDIGWSGFRIDIFKDGEI